MMIRDVNVSMISDSYVIEVKNVIADATIIVSPENIQV